MTVFFFFLYTYIWKHLFLDALLPGNANEIPIHDIRLCEPEILAERLSKLSGELLINSYELALNYLKFDEQSQIDILRDYLSDKPNDKGKLKQAIERRLQNVLSKDQGAISCLQSVLNDKLPERGSLRRQFALKLTGKIKHTMSEVLMVLFENHNLKLYQSVSQIDDGRMDTVFLMLLEEPRISRVLHVLRGDDILDGATFPFSSHIHAFISSLRRRCFDTYEQLKSEGDNGLVKVLMSQINTSLIEFRLGVKFDEWPLSFMRALIHDVIELEQKNNLRLHRFSKDLRRLLAQHLCNFVEHASMNVWKKYYFSSQQEQQQQQQQQQQQEHRSKLNHKAERESKPSVQFMYNDDNSDEDGEDYHRRLQASQDVEKLSNEVNANEDKEAKALEFHADNAQPNDHITSPEKTITFQLTATYAIWWSHEALLSDFLNVLSLFESAFMKLTDNLKCTYIAFGGRALKCENKRRE
ncbi:hypothetical protein RFI_07169 [Reticulomyxa filosa]|uniref:Uncharacterized protein n=1 Tax=Reticulomyxa filosa TaxID=46433 RepID=X6NVC5_RETFI|nr:hypothetical protein RFI_07169 [Reticulomyxa filosa]|eukprot:ETO29951.1 hypothetical protein RFI_07169 [Reticulomyxa filosa]